MLPAILLSAAAFFAFDNATGRDQKLPLEQQAALLKRSGYAGMGLFTGTARIPAVLSALDAQGLRLLAIYVHAFVDASGPRFDPGLPEAIRQLRGRETMIMLTLRGRAADDSGAIGVVREVADMAAEAGLRVCLYPHAGFYVETAADAVRVLRKAGRRNVGAAFNLPHELRAQRTHPVDWRAVFDPVKGDVFMASVGGIGPKDSIVRLDRSEYDVLPFLQALRAAGYTGPVSLQGYNVPGDVGENLDAAMREWLRLQKELK